MATSAESAAKSLGSSSQGHGLHHRQNEGQPEALLEIRKAVMTAATIEVGGGADDPTSAPGDGLPVDDLSKVSEQKFPSWIPSDDAFGMAAEPDVLAGDSQPNLASSASLESDKATGLSAAGEEKTALELGSGSSGSGSKEAGQITAADPGGRNFPTWIEANAPGSGSSTKNCHAQVVHYCHDPHERARPGGLPSPRHVVVTGTFDAWAGEHHRMHRLPAPPSDAARNWRSARARAYHPASNSSPMSGTDRGLDPREEERADADARAEVAELEWWEAQVPLGAGDQHRRLEFKFVLHYTPEQVRAGKAPSERVWRTCPLYSTERDATGNENNTWEVKLAESTRGSRSSTFDPAFAGVQEDEISARQPDSTTHVSGLRAWADPPLILVHDCDRETSTVPLLDPTARRPILLRAMSAPQVLLRPDSPAESLSSASSGSSSSSVSDEGEPDKGNMDADEHPAPRTFVRRASWSTIPTLLAPLEVSHSLAAANADDRNPGHTRLRLVETVLPQAMTAAPKDPAYLTPTSDILKGIDWSRLAPQPPEITTRASEHDEAEAANAAAVPLPPSPGEPDGHISSHDAHELQISGNELQISGNELRISGNEKLSDINGRVDSGLDDDLPAEKAMAGIASSSPPPTSLRKAKSIERHERHVHFDPSVAVLPATWVEDEYGVPVATIPKDVLSISTQPLEDDTLPLSELRDEKFAHVAEKLEDLTLLKESSPAHEIHGRGKTEGFAAPLPDGAPKDAPLADIEEDAAIADAVADDLQGVKDTPSPVVTGVVSEDAEADADAEVEPAAVTKPSLLFAALERVERMPGAGALTEAEKTAVVRRAIDDLIDEPSKKGKAPFIIRAPSLPEVGETKLEPSEEVQQPKGKETGTLLPADSGIVAGADEFEGAPERGKVKEKVQEQIEEQQREDDAQQTLPGSIVDEQQHTTKPGLHESESSELLSSQALYAPLESEREGALTGEAHGSPTLQIHEPYLGERSERTERTATATDLSESDEMLKKRRSFFTFGSGSGSGKAATRPGAESEMPTTPTEVSASIPKKSPKNIILRAADRLVRRRSRSHSADSSDEAESPTGIGSPPGATSPSQSPPRTFPRSKGGASAGTSPRGWRKSLRNLGAGDESSKADAAGASAAHSKKKARVVDEEVVIPETPTIFPTLKREEPQRAGKGKAVLKPFSSGLAGRLEGEQPAVSDSKGSEGSIEAESVIKDTAPGAHVDSGTDLAQKGKTFRAGCSPTKKSPRSPVTGPSGASPDDAEQDEDLEPLVTREDEGNVEAELAEAVGEPSPEFAPDRRHTNVGQPAPKELTAEGIRSESSHDRTVSSGTAEPSASSPHGNKGMFSFKRLFRNVRTAFKKA